MLEYIGAAWRRKLVRIFCFVFWSRTVGLCKYIAPLAGHLVGWAGDSLPGPVERSQSETDGGDFT